MADLDPDGPHGLPDYSCRCGRIHCGECGDVWPCRWRGAPRRVVIPVADVIARRWSVLTDVVESLR